MSKDEKCTCKACKNTVFRCQICKFVGFLLPSSSWLLKLPFNSVDIKISCFHFPIDVAPQFLSKFKLHLQTASCSWKYSEFEKSAATTAVKSPTNMHTQLAEQMIHCTLRTRSLRDCTLRTRSLRNCTLHTRSLRNCTLCTCTLRTCVF